MLIGDKRTLIRNKRIPIGSERTTIGNKRILIRSTLKQKKTSPENLEKEFRTRQFIQETVLFFLVEN